MKLHTLLLAAALALPTAAFAQMAPAAAPDMKIYATSAEVQALIAKAKAMPAKPLIIQPILSLAPYSASLEYRVGEAAPASVHDTNAELMYVLEGSGTLVDGGTLIDAKASNGNSSGSGVKDGTSHPLAKGDFAMVPQGVAHQLVPAAGQALILMTFKAPRGK